MAAQTYADKKMDKDNKYKRAKVIFPAVIFTLAICVMSYAQAVSLKEILADPVKFDEEIVEVEGEFIGDFIKDKAGVWINILSEDSNIGVFSQKGSLDKTIKFRGSYKENGDTLKIRGTFYKRCGMHQEMDIHANSISVVKKGSLRKDAAAPYKIRMAIISFIICLTTALTYFIKVWRKKR